jgi:hypothetical protein
MPRSVLAAATRKQARYTLRAISLRKLPSNGNVDGFIQRWWLAAKIMMGERAPARRIPSACCRHREPGSNRIASSGFDNQPDLLLVADEFRGKCPPP